MPGARHMGAMRWPKSVNIGGVAICTHCSSVLPDSRAKFCPRCGQALAIAPVTAAPGTKPVHIEHGGTLINPFFIVSVIIVVAGGLLAGHENYVLGGVLLVIGLPSLLVATVKTLSR